MPVIALQRVQMIFIIKVVRSFHFIGFLNWVVVLFLIRQMLRSPNSVFESQNLDLLLEN